jgi:hypothetical protein
MVLAKFNEDSFKINVSLFYVTLANLILLTFKALGLRLVAKYEHVRALNVILYLLKTVSFVVITWLLTGEDSDKEM